MSDLYLLEPMEMSVTSRRFMDGWDYEPTKHKWLADALWWALGKLGAIQKRMSTAKTYRLREPKNARNVVEAVANAVMNAERFHHKPNSYAIIMGYETYRDFMKEQSELMPMGGRSWEFSVNLGYNGQILGVPVHVVETVKGVAVVPKVVIEHHASKPQTI